MKHKEHWQGGPMSKDKHPRCETWPGLFPSPSYR